MSGRVIYAGFEFQQPMGGIRMLSQHVSMLVAAGVDAYRWSPTPGFRYTWFHDDVPTLSGLQIDLHADDTLVVPEIVVLPNRDYAPGGRVVIFSQTPHMHFLNCPDIDRYPGWDTEPSIWTVSRAGVELLSRTIPHLPPPQLVLNPVDAELFRPASRRVRSIAWMSRKRPMESTLLSQLLRHDPRGAGVELRDIRGLGHAEVARIMSDTSVFVALNAPEGEGFGLPVAEAMASGCLVTGYPMDGGEELFEAPAAWPVYSQRVVDLADQALTLLDTPDQDEIRAAGRHWVTERYNEKVTMDALLGAVQAARSRPASAARATHPSAFHTEWSKVLIPGWIRDVSRGSSAPATA
ncbi:MAG TPA: glycosyltransferase [Streptosporangiaceae bacterium]|jgi:hypothetical protein